MRIELAVCTYQHLSAGDSVGLILELRYHVCVGPYVGCVQIQAVDVLGKVEELVVVSLIILGRALDHVILLDGAAVGTPFAFKRHFGVA